MKRIYQLIDALEKGEHLSREEWVYLIENRNEEAAAYLFEKAVNIRQKYYGNGIFIRGLIEFTNYCKNDCLYCGIRRSNGNCQRYRLSEEEILECCRLGYDLGYRTFVLQGGEDPYYTDEKIASLTKKIKKAYPDCALTLSVGERKKESYRLWKEAGADRYLLRHETADELHYRKMHPKEMSFSNRIRCLYDLKELGYQVGCGFMVESPFQTADSLAQDMLFIEKLQPDMVGIGPFIPHKDTPFGKEKQGSLELTLYLLGLLRLLLPKALIPATTALGTIDPRGREKGVCAGANVCMPNLSPKQVRKKYELYDNKICTGDEAAECRGCLDRRMQTVGCKLIIGRGDRYGL